MQARFSAQGYQWCLVSGGAFMGVSDGGGPSYPTLLQGFF